MFQQHARDARPDGPNAENARREEPTGSTSAGSRSAPGHRLTQPAQGLAHGARCAAKGTGAGIGAAIEMPMAPPLAPSCSAAHGALSDYKAKAKALKTREFELERSLRALSKYSATGRMV